MLTEFAEAFGIPVAHTMSGKGAIACTNPPSVGLFGRFSRIANDIIEAADCLLVVGCKLGEIATRWHSLLSDATPLIHLDRCPEEFGRTARATIALWGDAAAGIADLHQELGKAAGHRCPHTGCEFWRPARLKAEIRAVNADVKHELMGGQASSRVLPYTRASRPSARAVVHVHSASATALSCLADVEPKYSLPPAAPYVVLHGPKVHYLDPAEVADLEKTFKHR